MSNIKQVRSLVQFTRGTNAVWEALVPPLPDGVVSFSVDNGEFKIGDGVTAYRELPVLFTYNDLVTAQGGIAAMFQLPIPADEGHVIVVGFDSDTGTYRYTISSMTLNGLLSILNAFESGNSTQDISIAQLMSIAMSVDASLINGPDDNLAVITNNKYSDSGKTAADIQAQIQASAHYVPGSHLMDPVFYTTADKKYRVDKQSLYESTRYFVDIVGFNNGSASPVFGLTCANTVVSITNVAGSLFEVNINAIADAQRESIPLIFICSIDGGDGHSTVKKAVTAKITRRHLLLSLYGNDSSSQFNGLFFDSHSQSIYAVGYDNYSNSSDALIVKFDTSLNVLARKSYAGSGADVFNAVAVDVNGIVTAVGFTCSEGDSSNGLGAGYHKAALVVRFDINLNSIVRRIYETTTWKPYFNEFNSVAVDAAGNIVAVGRASSVGLPGSGGALIVKFDSSLNIMYSKLTTGTYQEIFYGVTIDSAGNIIAVGATMSEGTGYGSYFDSLIVKFSPTLTILSARHYGATQTGQPANNSFYDVITDLGNNIIVVGVAYSGVSLAAIAKFDSNLNLLAGKQLSTGGSNGFNSVAINSSGEIVCVTRIPQLGLAICTFDSNLTQKYIKTLSCPSNNGNLNSIVIDQSDNMYIAGYSTALSSSNFDTLAIVSEPHIQSGMMASTNTSLNAFVFDDITTSQFIDCTNALAASSITVQSETLVTTSSSLLVGEPVLSQIIGSYS